MTEEELKPEEVFKKDLKDFFEKLVGLCYAYDRVPVYFKMIHGRSLREAKSIQPALGDINILELLNRFFGASTSGNIMFNGEPGKSLLSAIDMLDDRFSDEEVRELIKEVLSIELPNPAEEYVKVCREHIDEDVQRILSAALQVYSEYYDYAEYEKLLARLKEQGIELSKDDIKGKLVTVASLGIVKLEDFGIRIPKKYRKFLRESG